jgi:Cu+-exporting ATPase
MKKLKLTIEGMHCAACASNVERAVKKIKGVSSASANIMTNKAIIEAEDSLNPEELKKAISNIGYKVVQIQ